MTTIYLDNNATTQIAPDVADAMWPWLTERFGNPSSLHAAGQEAAEAVAAARVSVARLVGARHASEIVFTSGGTESNQAALRAAIRTRAPRRRVLASSVEHSAVSAQLDALEREGFEVLRAPVDRDGKLSIEWLASSIDERCAVASVMWVNNETGAIHDVAAVARLCERAGVPLHVDAVQAVGKLPIDLTGDPDAGGIAYLTLSAHKLHGPKGVGALYVRRGRPFEPLIVGGPQEGDRRAGTENVAGIVGFGRAAELATAWLASDGPTTTARLRDLLEQAVLAAAPDVEVAARASPRAPHTTNLVFHDVSGEALVMYLSEQGVFASSGSACSSGLHEPSPVLRAMGYSPAEASSSLRLSLSRATTALDVEAAAAIVVRAAIELRRLAVAR